MAIPERPEMENLMSSPSNDLTMYDDVFASADNRALSLRTDAASEMEVAGMEDSGLAFSGIQSDANE